MYRIIKKIDYYKIIVLDNGSTDGFLEAYRGGYPGISDMVLMRSEKNLGFAVGCNVAIEYALMNGADYVFLLNNDTVVDKDVLTNLVKEAERSREIGAVGAKIYYYRRPNVIWSTGGRFYYRQAGRGKADNPQFDKTRKVDWLPGTAMLIKAEALRKVGVFDSRFFFVYEDIEWSIRARKAGYQLICIPEAKVWHKIAGSSVGERGPFVFYYAVKNCILGLKKHRELKYRLSYILRILDMLAKSMIRMGKGNFRVFKAAIRGLYDGMRNRWPPACPDDITIFNPGVKEKDGLANVFSASDTSPTGSAVRNLTVVGSELPVAEPCGVNPGYKTFGAAA